MTLYCQDAQSYADDNSLLFMETSAKTSMNVNEIFMAIGRVTLTFHANADAMLRKSENDVGGEEIKAVFFLSFMLAKRLPKSEPQAAGGSSGRNRGVDLTEAAQPAKAPCCT